MKKLSIEEKAKRYDESIKEASIAYKDEDRHLKATLERIFPELKESEDERIMGAIIDIIKSQKEQQCHIDGAIYDEMIAWLERQGEQKPTDKVEPKFKIGDWVVFNGLTLFINDIVQDYYRTTSIDGIPNSYGWDIDNGARLWTIEDAKKGDVLCLGGVIAIFKKYISQEKCICYCSFCDNGGFEIPIENGEDNVYGCTDTTPATQEKRDLLFAKMHEAGYEWDADKKELKNCKL